MTAMTAVADPPTALRLRGVKKRFGRLEALRGIDLTVPRGSIFGLIGPNGAGKTTTFSICCGFLRPDGGSIDVLDAGPFDPHVHKGRVTSLPQDAALGPETSGRDHLIYLARLQGIPAARAATAAAEALAMVGLADRARDR